MGTDIVAPLPVTRVPFRPTPRTGGVVRASGVIAAVVLVATVLVAWRLTLGTGGRMAARSSSHAAGLPSAALQFRPVRSTRAARCRPVAPGSQPSAGRSVVLPAPGARGLCLWLGPAILSARSVTDVRTGTSEAGLAYVTVTLHDGDRRRLLARADPGRTYAVVALGHVLSTPSGEQLAAIGGDGEFPVAGGMTSTDPLPGQLAHVLGSPLVARSPMQLHPPSAFTGRAVPEMTPAVST